MFLPVSGNPARCTELTMSHDLFSSLASFDSSNSSVLLVRDVDGKAPPPSRRVVLAWRKSFTRYEAIAALRNAIYACELPGVTRLT